MRQIFGILLLLSCSLCWGQVAPQFFSMSTGNTSDMPKVPYGTLGHPGPLVWTAVEGTGRGAFNFKSIDAFVKKAPKVNGVAQIDLALGWTPAWAVANQSSCKKVGQVLGCTVPPDNILDWTDFITALIAHYNGTTAPHVAFYEIWNEANNPTCWTASVAELAAMGAAAYPILKTDPYSQVLTPSVIWQGPKKMLTGMAFTTQYLAQAPADGVTFHAYTCKTSNESSGECAMPESSASTNAPLQTMISSYQGVANGLPLFVTEGSWGVHGVTDPDLQAAWAAHYLAIGASYAQSANLIFLSWFEWGVPTLAQSGDIEQANRSPNEAGVAYEVVEGWLTGAMTTPCTNSGTIWTCTAGSNLIIWDASQTCSNGNCTTNPYAVSGYTAYFDLTGTEYQIQDGTVPLGIKPFLLTP
jgi:hypothetical protein